MPLIFLGSTKPSLTLRFGNGCQEFCFVGIQAYSDALQTLLDFNQVFPKLGDLSFNFKNILVHNY